MMQVTFRRRVRESKDWEYSFFENSGAISLFAEQIDSKNKRVMDETNSIVRALFANTPEIQITKVLVECFLTTSYLVYVNFTCNLANKNEAEGIIRKAVESVNDLDVYMAPEECSEFRQCPEVW